MSKRDYYEILGVAKTASINDIKKAYRKLAMQYHPDKNPGNKEAETKFKEASEAYAVLSDDSKRKQYDQFGHSAFEGMGGGAGGFDFSNFQGFEGFEDIFGDLFGSIFGGATSGSRSGRSFRGHPGNDLKYDLHITFEEAAFGTEKEIEVRRRRTCGACSGTGASKGSSPETCDDCGGQGQVRMQQGFFAISRPCPKCRGTGQTIKNPCVECRGQGLKATTSKLKVNVPAGIDESQRLKLRGEGESGLQGGPEGDLYVVIRIKPHKVFERHDSDVICEFPITYTTAVLGGEITVPTLDGKANIKIPTGTASGKIFRLKNKGIQILGTNQRGDQHVRVFVEIPKKLSEKYKEALEKLKIIEAEERQGKEETIFDKVKNIFQ